MSETLESGILTRATILIIDSDKTTRERLERFLLLSATHKVHTATSPLLALRIIQDSKAAVSCIIFTHKPGNSGTIEFLENLRQGRWSNRMRKVPIVLHMPRQDDAVIQAADCLGANGYLIGELERDAVISTVTNVLTNGECDSPLARFPVAHVRIAGADAILIPLAQDITALPADRQRAATDAFQAAATVAGLAGAIVPLWMRIDESISFLAPPELHAALGALRPDFVTVNLNRRLSISCDHGISSGAAPGLAFYAPPAPGTVMGAGGKSGATDPESRTQEHDGGGGPQKTKSPAAGRPGAEGITRLMTPDDVTKVIAAFKQLGAEKFAKAFLREQTISRLTAGKMVPLMKEYYFSLEALRQALFRDADMRESNMFGELTLALDQALLRSLAHLPSTATPFSLNLNVQSCFTKPFEAFLEQAPAGQLTIEFRQPNIVEFYDEYVIARSMLENKGIRIAVDGILPDTIGLVSMEYVGAAMAKVSWGEGAADSFRARAKALAYILESGIELVINRVDEKAAISLGNAFGIDRFQGRLLDDLARRAA